MQQVLNELNIPFTCQKRRFPRELTTLAKNYANTKPNKNDILIVVGGDGSFNEVLMVLKLQTILILLLLICQLVLVTALLEVQD